MNFMSIRKGIILNKIKDSQVRYVVVDYDDNNIYCIDLNSNNRFVRKVIKLSYDKCNEEFEVE